MVTLPGRDIVVVAASAGGLAPLRTLLAGLPADLPASVFVVLHVPATGGRTLPYILNRAGQLPVSGAVDGEKMRPGRVYVAAPDRHLLIVNDVVRLSRGPRQNGLRPAADPLFRSAALYGGARTVAVVLSGALDDAALGSATVERRGGVVAVQDPAESAHESMPRSAVGATKHPVVASAHGLATLINRLARQSLEVPPTEPEADLEAEVENLLARDPGIENSTRDYSGFTCPDCGGPLYYAQEEKAASYDCLVGHRWSPQTLLEEQSTTVERAFWLAIRSLDERGRLTDRLADAARARGHVISAHRFHAAAREARQAADHIRNLANRMNTVAEEFAEPEPEVAGGAVQA